MSDISTTKGFSLDPYQDAQMKKKYNKHINKILEIAEQQPKIKEIRQEQQRISNILKRSKDIAKTFHEKQFLAKRDLQNQRLKKSLNSIHLISGKLKLDKQEANKKKMKMKTITGKQPNIREIQIQRQNRHLANNIIQQALQVQKYKKKLQKQIADYLHLKNKMQKLKAPAAQKRFHHNKQHGLNSKSQMKLKMKTLKTQRQQQNKLPLISDTINLESRTQKQSVN